MTALRQRMDEAMVLRGFAQRTRETYLACVTGLAKHYHSPPDRLDAAQIQAYLLHLIQQKKLAYASVNQAACACRFLFERVLQRPNARLDIPMAKVPKRLPVILTRDEVQRLFGACATLRARTVLMTTYAAGLRVSEVGALQVGDIESAPDRMCIKVRQGKGGQDRYTLLSPRLLETLRLYWQTCRPRLWLFPNKAGDGPMGDQTAQRMYWAACAAAGLTNAAGIHTLRHSFATHMLENGVNIRVLQELLGHADVKTTEIYTHVMARDIRQLQSPLDRLPG